MGARIRLFEPGVVYNAVSRTVDRTFSFAPNHRKDNQLLRFDCPGYGTLGMATRTQGGGFVFPFPTNLVVGILFGGIAVYLLSKGIRGLRRKYLITSNPDADSIPTSHRGLVFKGLQNIAREKFGPPVAFDRGPTTKVTGGDLYLRVVMYIIGGLVSLFVGVVLAVPGAADLLIRVLDL